MSNIAPRADFANRLDRVVISQQATRAYEASITEPSKPDSILIELPTGANYNTQQRLELEDLLMRTVARYSHEQLSKDIAGLTEIQSVLCDYRQGLQVALDDIIATRSKYCKEVDAVEDISNLVELFPELWGTAGTFSPVQLTTIEKVWSLGRLAPTTSDESIKALQVIGALLTTNVGKTQVLSVNPALAIVKQCLNLMDSKTFVIARLVDTTVKTAPMSFDNAFRLWLKVNRDTDHPKFVLIPVA